MVSKMKKRWIILLAPVVILVGGYYVFLAVTSVPAIMEFSRSWPATERAEHDAFKVAYALDDLAASNLALPENTADFHALAVEAGVPDLTNYPVRILGTRHPDYYVTVNSAFTVELSRRDSDSYGPYAMRNEEANDRMGGIQYKSLSTLGSARDE